MSGLSTPTHASDPAATRTLDAILAGATDDAGNTPRWMAEARAAAIARAAELGMPRKSDEEWRYTNPGPLLETPYVPIAGGHDEGDAPIDELPITPAVRLVFVDGRFDPARSDLDRQPQGLRVEPLAGEHTQADAQALAPILDRARADARDGLEALGCGLLSCGAVVRLADGAALDRPILIVFRAEREDPALTAPLVAVLAGEGAQAEVIEDHQGAQGAAGLTLGRTELRVSRGARVEHVTLERQGPSRSHVSTLRLVQSGASFARSHRVLLGGSIVRNNIHATIEGEHAECAFNGLFVPEHRQHHDTHIRVEHMAPNCQSRQFYRGLLADRARGVFTGRIYVRDIAQKTDAIQSNANLLLSPAAQVTAKPQLEIYADDVRCTHGATSGMIDADALFYLRARGVPERAARLLLLHAFAGENLDRIANQPLRDRVREIIFQRLDAALGRQPRTR